MNGLWNESPEPGEMVQVADGQLRGVRGVLVRITQDGRAVVQLDGATDILLAIEVNRLELLPAPSR